MFFKSSCNNLIGYTLGSDTNAVVGLSQPIHESIKTLKQHKNTLIDSKGPGTDGGVPLLSSGWGQGGRKEKGMLSSHLKSQNRLEQHPSRHPA